MKYFLKNYFLLGILLLTIFCNQLIWINAIPYNFAPDEYAHFDIIERFITTGKYPQFLENPSRGILIKENQITVSYSALPPIPYLIDSYILKLFSQNVSQNHWYLFARLGSTLALLITVISIFLLILEITGKKYFALIGGIITGFLPQMAFLGAYTNNDIWAIAGSSVSIYLSTKIFLDKKISSQLLIFTGFIFGCTLLTLWNVLPILGLCLGLIFLKLRKSVQQITKLSLLTLSIIVTSSWWFIKNWLLYQDITLINKFYEIAKLTRPQEFRSLGLWKLFTASNWLEITLKSTFGVFDWNYIYMPENFYIIFALIVCITLILILINRNKFSHPLIVLIAFYILCIISLIILASVQSATRFFQPQGRYLLPTVAGFVTLLVLGLNQFWKSILLKITTIFILFANIYSLINVIIPRYYAWEKTGLTLYRQAFWEMIFEKPFPFDKWGLIVIMGGGIFFFGLVFYKIICTLNPHLTLPPANA